MKTVVGATALVMILTFMSCTRTVHCSGLSTFGIEIAGIDSAEVDSVIVYGYEAGNNFQHPSDTVVLTKYGSSVAPPLYFRSDTTSLNTVNAQQGKDYLIQVRPQGRIWKLSGVEVTDATMKVASDKSYIFTCPLKTYTVDGVAYYYPYNNEVYLLK